MLRPESASLLEYLVRQRVDQDQTQDLLLVDMCVELRDDRAKLCSNQDDWRRLLTAGRDQLSQVVHHSVTRGHIFNN